MMNGFLNILAFVSRCDVAANESFDVRTRALVPRFRLFVSGPCRLYLA